MLMNDGFVYLRRPSPDKPIECNISRESEIFVPNGLSIVVYDKEMEYIVNCTGFVFEKDKPKAKQELKKVSRDTCSAPMHVCLRGYQLI